MIFISSSECVSLSWFDLIPKIFSITAEQTSKILINGKNTSQNRCNGRAINSTVFSVFAIARDFGTSSPSTTWKSVTIINAITNAIVWMKISPAPNRFLSGPSISLETAGSPIQPSARELIVIPSWVALKYVSREFEILSARRAFATSAATNSSSFDFRILTIENSDRTKNAFKATRKNARININMECDGSKFQSLKK